MDEHVSLSDMEAFLDEALPHEQMAEIETALRSEEELQLVLVETISRRDTGVHSLGEIWRRHRASCSSREELGSYLLAILPADQQAYIDFHLKTVGCRYCQANLEDLREAATAGDDTTRRRQRYFESSAGYLQR
jgi:hypothetical protein